jgi:hypothetical protein
VSALHERILRQEPLVATRSTLTTHKQSVYHSESDIAVAGAYAVAGLRDRRGRQYPLNGASTRIGRHSDNDIVLDDDTDVSRYHAVIIDTGAGFVIYDSKSTNGVEVQRRRIRGSAPLAGGDHIRIGSQEFTFEIRPG